MIRNQGGSRDWCVWLNAESHAVCINIPSFHITSRARQSNHTCCPLSSTHRGSFWEAADEWDVNEKGGGRPKYSQMHSWDGDDSERDFVWRVFFLSPVITLETITFNNIVAFLVSRRRPQHEREGQCRGRHHWVIPTVGPNSSRN